MIEMEDQESDEGDLIVEGRNCYLGTDRIHRSTVNRLIQCGAIKPMAEDLPYWIPNEMGRSIARRPELADEYVAAVLGGKGPFKIVGDQLVPMDSGEI